MNAPFTMDSVDTTRMEEMLNDIAVHLGAAANEILKNENHQN